MYTRKQHIFVFCYHQFANAFVYTWLLSPIDVKYLVRNIYACLENVSTAYFLFFMHPVMCPLTENIKSNMILFWRHWWLLVLSIQWSIHILISLFRNCFRLYELLCILSVLKQLSEFFYAGIFPFGCSELLYGFHPFRPLHCGPIIPSFVIFEPSL